MVTSVKVLHEVSEPNRPKNDWHLGLQQAEFKYSDGSSRTGYRFICRPAEGKPEREAHLPSLAAAEDLIGLARKAGWG